MRVTSLEEIPVAVAQAFARMTSGRPRPVHLEVPLDLLVAEGDAAPVAPVAPVAAVRPTRPRSTPRPTGCAPPRGR